jgi:hypothetical protein
MLSDGEDAMRRYVNIGAIATVFIIGSASFQTFADETDWKGTVPTNGVPTTVEKKGTTTTITVPQGEEKPPVVLTAPLTGSKEIEKQATVKWYDTSYSDTTIWSGSPKHSGYAKVFEIINTGACKEWGFIQLKSFRVIWKPSNEQAFPPIPKGTPPGQDIDTWDIDGPSGPKDPNFGTIPGLPQGETSTIDIPGAFNGTPSADKTWGTPGHISQHLKTVFRIWIRCLNPKEDYGYLEWGFEIDRDAPKGANYSTLKPNPPKWHDAKDEPEEKARLDRMVQSFTK